MSQYLFRAPEQRGPWEVLAAGEQTGGRAVFGDAVLAPGDPTPGLHQHSREDESAYVIAGTVTFQVGADRFEAGPGSLVWLPRDVPHTFANLGDEVARMVGMITPAGIEGMFAEQDRYFSSLQGPPDEAVLEELASRYGLTRLGPPLTA